MEALGNEVLKGTWEIDENTKSVVSNDTTFIGNIVCDAPEYAEESMLRWPQHAKLIVIAGNLAQKYPDLDKWEQALEQFFKS